MPSPSCGSSLEGRSRRGCQKVFSTSRFGDGVLLDFLWFTFFAAISNSLVAQESLCPHLSDFFHNVVNPHYLWLLLNLAPSKLVMPGSERASYNHVDGMFRRKWSPTVTESKTAASLFKGHHLILGSPHRSTCSSIGKVPLDRSADGAALPQPRMAQPLHT